MRFFPVIALVLAVGACAPDEPNRTPEGAVRELIELLQVFDGNDKQAQTLFLLLSSRAKQNLVTRADRYGAASGKTISPWAMLVPSRMTPRFAPEDYSAQIVGRHALVEVVGVGAEQKAHVSCVLEDGLWRVDIVLPELPPLERRPGAEP